MARAEAPLDCETSVVRPVGAGLVVLVLLLFVVGSFFSGANGRKDSGAPVAGEVLLDFLRANDCVLADVHNGQARLYRCDSVEGPVHLTPEQVHRLIAEHPGGGAARGVL